MIRKDYTDIIVALLFFIDFVSFGIGPTLLFQFNDYILGSIIFLTSLGNFVFFLLYEIALIIIEKRIQNYRGGRHPPLLMLIISLLSIMIILTLPPILLFDLIFPVNPWFFTFLMCYFYPFPIITLAGILILRKYLEKPKIISIIQFDDATKTKQLILYDREKKVKRILEYDIKRGSRESLVIENSSFLPRYFWLKKVKKKVHFKNLILRIRLIALDGSPNIQFEQFNVRCIKSYSRTNIKKSKINVLKLYSSKDSTINECDLKKVVMEDSEKIKIENCKINKLRLKRNQGCKFINCNIVQLKTKEYIENEFEHSTIEEVKIFSGRSQTHI